MDAKVALSDVVIELHVDDFDKVRNFYSKLGFNEVWSYPPNNQSGYLVMQRNNSVLAFFCGNDQVYNHAFFKKYPKIPSRVMGLKLPFIFQTWILKCITKTSFQK